MRRIVGYMDVFKGALAALLAVALAIMMLPGCSVDLRHLTVSEQENPNSAIQTWDDAVSRPDVTTWDDVSLVSWDDLDDIASPIYSAMLFDGLADGFPVVDTVVLDYRSNGRYFEGEKVYELVGSKFNLNKLVADVAIGTSVVVVCALMESSTAGAGTPIALFFAGSAEKAIEFGAIGAVFGGAIESVESYIENGADWGQTLFGTLEGAADGYKWGAMFGAVTNGVLNVADDFSKSTVKYFDESLPQAEKYPEGVRFDSRGYARFEKYKIAEAKFDFPTQDGMKEGRCLTGVYKTDAKLANEACGYAETPEGYVWHHVEDMRTMILVPQDLHSPTFHGMGHRGGASKILERVASWQ